MIGLQHYLVVSAILFVMGVLGIFINRKNIIIILMAIELILLSVNINLVAFSAYLGDLVGQVFAMFVLTVAAAEAAITASRSLVVGAEAAAEAARAGAQPCARPAVSSSDTQSVCRRNRAFVRADNRDLLRALPLTMEFHAFSQPLNQIALDRGLAGLGLRCL